MDARDYLSKHDLPELFGDLAAALLFHRPEDVNSFLCQQLQLRSRQGRECGKFDYFG